MKTYSPTPRDIDRNWYVLDAEGVVLGRLATQAATILRGKHKPSFAPHMDMGDHVIIINAKGVALTGDKLRTKMAYRHSGYPGGLTATSYGTLLAERPSRAVEKAVRGMLPKTSLGRQMLTKLRVYDGPTHEHQAQQPVALAAGEFPRWNGLPGREAPALAVVKSAPAKAPTEAKTAPAAVTAVPKPAPAKAAAAPAKKPAAAKPAAVKKAAAKKPVAKAAPKKAAAKKPVAKKAAAKKPVAKKPVAKKPAAKKPAPKKSKGA